MNRVNSTLRQEDENLSTIISNFLDKHFYNKCTSFERVNDEERQVKGLDTLFSFGDLDYACDEKAAVRYINKNLRTFSFELSFLRRDGETMDGWLLSDKEENNSFLLCWIDRARSDKPRSDADIIQMEVALVRRVKLLEHLNKLGWTKERLLRKARRIREQYHENLGNIETNGCKFVFSELLAEKPVNVLLSREVLLNIADKHDILTQNS